MRRLLVVVLALLLVPVAAPAAAAAERSFPARIDLPAGFFPEGIESGRGTTVYVGSLYDGRIWRGDVRSGHGRIWAPSPGAPAAGVAYDARRHLLWVAGASSMEVRAYDTRTARLLRTYHVPGNGFLNDVAVTRDAVYVTDSFVQRLVVLRYPRCGRLPAQARSLPLRGDIVYVSGTPQNPAFNANGIVATRGELVIDQSATGQLFRVDPRTGVAREIGTFGTDLVGADGLELRGPLLYVVLGGSPGRVQRMVLGPRLRNAVPAGQIVSDRLDYPTTAAYVAGALYVVNARFATPRTPTTPYWITRLRG